MHVLDGNPTQIFVKSAYKVGAIRTLALPRPVSPHITCNLLCRLYPACVTCPSHLLQVETSDAERIGVDQVAKILPSGKATGSEQRECTYRQCMQYRQ